MSPWACVQHRSACLAVYYMIVRHCTGESLWFGYESRDRAAHVARQKIMFISSPRPTTGPGDAATLWGIDSVLSSLIAQTTRSEDLLSSGGQSGRLSSGGQSGQAVASHGGMRSDSQERRILQRRFWELLRHTEDVVRSAQLSPSMGATRRFVHADFRYSELLTIRNG